MTTQELLEKADPALVKRVTLPASTGKGDAKTSTNFEANLPTSVENASAILGPKKVHRLIINALVVELQGAKRKELAPKGGEKKERKKAPYLEELGM